MCFQQLEYVFLILSSCLSAHANGSVTVSQHGNEQLSRACPQGPHYVEINIIVSHRYVGFEECELILVQPEIFVNQCNAGSQYGGGLKFPLSSCQSYEG